MDIKAYIDQFKEISDLPREKQFSLLDSAQKRISKNLKVPIFTVLSTVLPIAFVIIAVLIGTQLFALPIWGIVLLVIGMLLIARVIVSELNSYFLYKGLLIELEEQAAE